LVEVRLKIILKISLQLMTIDWRQPWFDIVGDIGQEHDALPLNVAHTLSQHATDSNLHFVSQDSLPQSQTNEAYEAFIFRTGQIPTRNNAHDFFNGLMWLSMPRTKRALNVLQATQIAQAGVKPTRGAVRDAATLFDENGAVLLTTSRALVEAWLAHDWLRLFVELRDEWKHARLLIFGHATLEKLLNPYKAITTHTLWIDAAHDLPLEQVDVMLAANIERIEKKDWQPLPVMGVPGWWPVELGVQDDLFYADAKVFRRRHALTPTLSR
jgi:Protein of unknown function (DUF3025)